MIPRTFHFIWFNEDGSNDVPEYALACIDSFFRHNSSFEIKLWLTSDINYSVKRHFPDDLRELFYDSSTMIVQKADIFRIWVLKTFGGIYVDTDVLCVNSFEELLKNNFFAGEERVFDKSHESKYKVSKPMHCVSNCVMGSVKNGVVINLYYKYLLQTKNEMRVSYGPKLIEKVLKQCKKTAYMLYDSEYFYPVSYFENLSDIQLTRKTKSIHLYKKTDSIKTKELTKNA